MRLEYLGDFLERFLNMFRSMRGHKAEADESILRSHSGRNHRINEYTLFEKIARNGKCLEIVADIEGYNRSRSVADLETALTESIESHIGKLP